MDRAEDRPPSIVGGPASTASWLVTSAVAGLIAGIVMLVFAMLATGITGDGFWSPPRAIAALFLGAAEAGAGFTAEPVLAGAVIHLVLSIIFGVICAVIIGMLLNRLPVSLWVFDGLLYGVMLWAINTLLIAPLLPGGELIEHTIAIRTIPSWVWLSGHLLYGVVLSLLYLGWRGGETTIARP